MFNLHQGGGSVNEYYVNLKGVMAKLANYHHMTIGAQVHQTQCNEFVVAKLLSRLDESLLPVHDQILSDESTIFIKSTDTSLACL